MNNCIHNSENMNAIAPTAAATKPYLRTRAVAADFSIGAVLDAVAVLDGILVVVVVMTATAVGDVALGIGGAEVSMVNIPSTALVIPGPGVRIVGPAASLAV